MRSVILALVLSTLTGCAATASTLAQGAGLTKEPRSDLHADHEAQRARERDAENARVQASGESSSTPVVKTSEEKQKYRDDRLTKHCAETRDERVADFHDAAVEWLEDSATIEKGGGLRWFHEHCQRGVDQYGRLMPAVCNAKLPRGATQQTVELALNRVIELSEMNPSLAPTALNVDCTASDAANGGALLIRKTDTESIKRFAASKINPRPKAVDASQMVGE